MVYMLNDILGDHQISLLLTNKDFLIFFRMVQKRMDFRGIYGLVKEWEK